MILYLAGQIVRLCQQLLIIGGKLLVCRNAVIGKCVSQRYFFTGRVKTPICIISENVELLFFQRKKTAVIFQKDKAFVAHFRGKRICRSSCNVDIGSGGTVFCAFPDAPVALSRRPPEKDQTGNQKQSNDCVPDSPTAMNAPFKGTKSLFPRFLFCPIRLTKPGFVIFPALLPFLS